MTEYKQSLSFFKMIQEKQAFMIVAKLSVKEFLCERDDFCTYWNIEPKEPTQQDYDNWLLDKATQYHIGAPSESQVFLK